MCVLWDEADPVHICGARHTACYMSWADMVIHDSAEGVFRETGCVPFGVL